MATVYTCDINEFCLYQDYDFNQGFSEDKCHQWGHPDSSYTNNAWYECEDLEPTGDGLNDEASSAWNRSGFRVRTLHQHANYSGANSSFGPGVADGYLANNSIGNNRASSHSST